MSKQEAEKILREIPGMEDVEIWIDKWLAKLEESNAPLVDWAKAFAKKAAKLDGGPAGFFVAMCKRETWTEWLDGTFKAVRKTAETVAERQWPYTRGAQSCKQCFGAGWYALRREEMSDEEDQMKQEQEANGIPALRYGHHQDRTVFLCNFCMPTMKPAFEDQSFPAYPVGANAVPPSHDPDVSFEAYISHA